MLRAEKRIILKCQEQSDNQYISQTDGKIRKGGRRNEYNRFDSTAIVRKNQSR